MTNYIKLGTSIVEKVFDAKTEAKTKASIIIIEFQMQIDCINKLF